MEGLSVSTMPVASRDAGNIIKWPLLLMFAITALLQYSFVRGVSVQRTLI